MALFCRFYPESHTNLKSTGKEEKELSPSEKTLAIQTLADKFAEGVPEHEFSTAELQGYLLTCKKEPEQAAEGVLDWVSRERKDRTDREVREAERKAKRGEASLARIGMVPPSTSTVTTAATGTTSVGQPPWSALEPTATMTTPSTPSTPGTPPLTLRNIDVAAIEAEAARHVARRLEGLALGNVDEGHSRQNGTTTFSGPITPPEI